MGSRQVKTPIPKLLSHEERQRLIRTPITTRVIGSLTRWSGTRGTYDSMFGGAKAHSHIGLDYDKFDDTQEDLYARQLSQ